MKRSFFLLSATVLLGACQASEKPAGSDAATESTADVDAGAEEQAIRAQVDRWHELMKVGDAAGVADLYTADGAVMPPNAPIGKGREAILATWSALLKTPGFGLQITPEEIVVASSGDMALDRGTYRLTVAPDGKPQVDTGKYVVVWRKIGGEWKAAADIINSDLPAS